MAGSLNIKESNRKVSVTKNERSRLVDWGCFAPVEGSGLCPACRLKVSNLKFEGLAMTTAKEILAYVMPTTVYSKGCAKMFCKVCFKFRQQMRMLNK